MSLEEAILGLAKAIEKQTEVFLASTGRAPLPPEEKTPVEKAVKHTPKKVAAAAEQAEPVKAEPVKVVPVATAVQPKGTLDELKLLANKLLNLSNSDRSGVVSILRTYGAAKTTEVLVKDLDACIEDFRAAVADAEAAAADAL